MEPLADSPAEKRRFLLIAPFPPSLPPSSSPYKDAKSYAHDCVYTSAYAKHLARVKMYFFSAETLEIPGLFSLLFEVILGRVREVVIYPP